MRNFAQGDLGDSMRFHRPVMELLVDRLPTTVELGFFALLFAISVGVPAGRAERLPSQIRAGCRHHDRRQYRRLHACVLAGPDAGLPLRRAAKGHALCAAAVRTPDAGRQPGTILSGARLGR